MQLQRVQGAGYTQCHLASWCSDPPLSLHSPYPPQVPLSTIERRRLDNGSAECNFLPDRSMSGVSADGLLRSTTVEECFFTESGVKKCNYVWELADPTMADIPADFLKGKTKLTGTLKLGAAVKTIGANAFRGTKLTGLDLSGAASLVTIGDYAFEYTDITGTLVIPANVETIGEGAFYETKLTGLDLSQAASLVSIGNSAFSHTVITGTLMIPANVETIGNYAFYNTKLTGLDLWNAASLVSIGDFAFGRTDITGTLVIPAKVKTIGEGAFSNSNLTGLDLSDATSLESIGNEAFAETEITGTIETPFTVPTYIENSAFPSGISIVKVLFWGLKECDDAPSGKGPCWELADPTMTDIPADFLKDRTDLTGTLKLGAAVKTIGSWAFYLTKLTGLDLSEATSLVTIGDRAFAFTDITGMLVIPAKVETIGNAAFSKTKLTGLDLSPLGDNVFYKTKLTIGNNAFDYTDIMGTLVIPAKVTAIGEYAFRYTKLKGLDLSDAASLVTIGAYAFYQTNLEGKLVILAKVDTIGRGAFAGTDIKSLDLMMAASLAWIGAAAFYGTKIMGTIETPFNVPAYIWDNAFPPGVTIVKV